MDVIKIGMVWTPTSCNTLKLTRLSYNFYAIPTVNVSVPEIDKIVQDRGGGGGGGGGTMGMSIFLLNHSL